MEIRLSRSPGERRVALLRDGRMIGYRLERPARPDGVGDVVRGRITALMPAMSGAFVALPGGEDGFLPESELPDRRIPPEGTYLNLKVTRAAQNGKGKRVSARMAQGEARPGPDQALRWAAAHAGATILADDAAEVARLRGLLGAERVRIGKAFDDELEDEAERLASPEWPLPGGGRMIFSPLPALVAVDVDSGGADPRETNRVAIVEFARQLRLRDLSGGIVLDLAGLSVKQRGALEEPLRAALAPDGQTQLLGLGPLGLFELRRARIHPPLHEVLADRALARGLALLRRAARESAAAPARQFKLCAPAPVLAALRAMPEALAEFAAGAGQHILLEVSDTDEIADA
ncbi:ribonuclease E/G [Roseococcus sp. YIM B11640]|uniref:ribonuclease E/G n=1 Tax=Roseococcus sp. YIM B11640 TaxID=3133973 RepID=UPI003C7C62C3